MKMVIVAVAGSKTYTTPDGIRQLCIERQSYIEFTVDYAKDEFGSQRLGQAFFHQIQT